MRPASDTRLYQRIYQVIALIPAGFVASYGDVATIVGGGCDARTVGYALNELPQDRADVPWQRVVNRAGAISTRGLRQRHLLEEEGVAFDDTDHIIMARHRWEGPDAAWASEHGFHPLPPRDEGERSEQLSLF